MARGRIFSSRRMFSTRRSSFAEPSKQSGPLGVLLGLLSAAVIIFVIGVFVGRSMSHTATAPISFSEPMTPFAVGVVETPAAPEADAEVPADVAPDAAVDPDPDASPEAAPEASTTEPLSNTPLSEPVAATEH